MEIRLFKHDSIVPKIGTIKFRTFKYNFAKVCLNNDFESSVQKIRKLIVQFGLLHLELKSTDGYFCFILIDAWPKHGINA